MSWFKMSFLAKSARPILCVAVVALSACTVEPLATSRTTPTASGFSSTISQAVLVETVSTRVEQQLRNALLFSLHGGTPPITAPYTIRITASASDEVLAIRGSSLAPTAAKVTLQSSYQLIENSSNRIIDSGSQTTVAAYDRTSQSFANARAKRDAENRAAQQAAQKIRFAISRALASR